MPRDIVERNAKKRIGTKMSLETRKKQSISHKGNKCHAWKGGITPLVYIIRRCFEYRQWKSDIFTRDNFTCVMCGKRGGDIQADHYPKEFYKIFNENNIKTFEQAIVCQEFWNINNGRTLCVKCHKFRHSKK